MFDFGNDIASPNDENLIADVDAEAVNLTHVVQGGVLNGYTAHSLRSNASDRRDVPRPARLPFHIQQHRVSFFGRKFPRQCPARMVGGHAQLLALSKVVQFEHHAIDFERVAAAFARPCNGRFVEELGGLGGGVPVVEFPRCRHNTELVFHPHQHVGVVVHVGDRGAVWMAVVAKGNLGIVGLEHKVGCIGFPVGMLLSQSASGEVARIG